MSAGAGTGHRLVMDEITADHAAVRRTVAGLRSAAARLATDRDRAARSVDELLGTWSGTLATAYASGWEEWLAGATRVLDGLTTMADLVERADAGLVAADAVSGADLGRLTARLG